MRVFKFGGASTADPGRMAALLPIIAEQNGPLLVVISALGKTTNALERIVNRKCRGAHEIAAELVAEVVKSHREFACTLLNEKGFADAQRLLENLFTALELAVANCDADRYDYSYDQVVCMGELFSSTILHCYLTQNGIKNVWTDVRKVIHTDDTYRDAVIDWNYSKLEAEAIIGRQLKQDRVVITQGFIGSAPDGSSVTLGREGSDYTASILAAMLNMESVTIWKDVDGFRNADPKQFPDTVRIDAITYAEVIEMAFYGAQIIHPKTIKPLHNSNIPLHVKCFLDRQLAGSLITADVGDAKYPPLIVLKERQVLVHVTTRDFSFITESNLSNLYRIFHDLKVKINLIQNAAISFIACIDDRPEKIIALKAALGTDYEVTTDENVALLTIRYFTPEVVKALIDQKQKLLCQETRNTLQVVMKQ
jgi:aspartate kinase